MNRQSKSTERRNQEIYAEYIAHLRDRTPSMMAYAIIANKYDLSEESIRKIVAKQAQGSP